MNVLIALAHPESKSFNGALFDTAVKTLSAAGHTPDGFNGDLDAILRPMQRGILEFTGFSVLRPQVHWQPVRVEPAERQAWLKAWSDRLRGIEQESPIAVGRY